MDPREDIYRKKLLLSTIIPGVIVFFMWLVKISEVLLGLDLTGGGIYPLELKGLPGIIFSPFIHADFKHLLNNSLPLFFLSVALFYFFSDSALKIFGWTYVLTGFFVWVAGRSAWHIGASGLVYGIASFLFFSGIIRKHLRLAALSMLIVFLYGSMVWGMFPDIYKNVSWESHMLGFISGIILTIVFRNEGPRPVQPDWMNEEEEEEKEEEESEEEKGREGEGEKRRGGEREDDGRT